MDNGIIVLATISTGISLLVAAGFVALKMEKMDRDQKATRKSARHKSAHA